MHNLDLTLSFRQGGLSTAQLLHGNYDVIPRQGHGRRRRWSPRPRMSLSIWPPARVLFWTSVQTTTWDCPAIQRLSRLLLRLWRHTGPACPPSGESTSTNFLLNIACQVYLWHSGHPQGSGGQDIQVPWQRGLYSLSLLLWCQCWTIWANLWTRGEELTFL